MEVSQRI